MFLVSELSEDVKAKKTDKDGNVIGEVVIPRGTKLSVQDMGDSTLVLAPKEYEGLVFISDQIKNE